MKTEMNRRFFLGVLGAAAAVAAAKGRPRDVPPPSASLPGGLCFPADSRREPAAQPRTAAILYLPTDA